MFQSRRAKRASAHLLSLSALAMLAMLGGCSLIDGPGPQPIACPPTGMLREGAELVRYRAGDGRDLTDVELAAKILDVSAACQLDTDETRDILMTLGVRMVVERGPAAPQGAQRLSYIVAITDSDRRFLSRQAYPLGASFSGTARQAGFEEVLALTIPMTPEQTAEDFRVYVSLQLRADEVDAALEGTK